MNYTLCEASQNRFILFDEPEYQAQEMVALLRETGRDDVLILSEKEYRGGNLYVKMQVLGLDGLFGEFCANGARACSLYLYTKYPKIKKAYLKTSFGNLLLDHDGNGNYLVTLPIPATCYNPKFVKDPQELFPFSYVEAIEPHLTVNAGLSDDALFALGKALNYNRALFPLGMNVNAWEVIGENTLFVKTYERGVQRLTKSCGTGAISAASQYKKEGMVQVVTPGGLLLLQFTDGYVTLSGSAQLDN